METLQPIPPAEFGAFRVRAPERFSDVGLELHDRRLGNILRRGQQEVHIDFGRCYYDEGEVRLLLGKKAEKELERECEDLTSRVAVEDVQCDDIAEPAVLPTAACRPWDPTVPGNADVARVEDRVT